MQIIGLNLLKKLGAVFVAVIFGTVLLQMMVAEVKGAGGGLLMALLLASPIAYVLRKACRRKPVRHPMRRARERTQIAADHFAEE